MTVTIMAVGDLIVDMPEPDFFFAPSTPVLSQGDVVIGQLEVPHSTSTNVASVDIPAPPADPAHLRAIARAGFNVVTLAGNHIADAGREGIVDTIRFAEEAGLLTTGAGADIRSARRPAITEHDDGTRVAVLSYNCVGPEETWASSTQAGAAYVAVMTHYELIGANPGGPARVYTFAEPTSLATMQRQTSEVAAEVDVVVVSLHKGLVHTPIRLAGYETVVAHAAVDAGADIVVAHHAHMPRGVELYRGRPIFHGLGNFVTVTRSLVGDQHGAAEREKWAARRRELFGFDPDPAMPEHYAFHPDSRNTMIAVFVVEAGVVERVGLVPCWIDDQARPVPVGDDAMGRKVLEHLREITAAEGFDTTFAWEGDRVWIGPANDEEKNR
jgi:hypothetical protein